MESVGFDELIVVFLLNLRFDLGTDDSDDSLLFYLVAVVSVTVDSFIFCYSIFSLLLETACCQ